MSRAILLTAYGSRHPGAHPSFDRMRQLVRQNHPDIPVAWSYTSKNVRKLVRADSPAEALAKLAKAGVRQVAMQSLHLVPGAEYEEMLAAAREHAAGFERLETGRPLLDTRADVEAAARALIGVADGLLRNPESPADAAVLVGHGTDHPGNRAYLSLADTLRSLDPRLHLGLLETEPGQEAILAQLRPNLNNGRGRVLLMPLLFSAGHHAATDLAGPGPESWKSGLVRSGFLVRTHLHGVAEHLPIARLWVEHLNETLLRLDTPAS